MKFKEGEVVYIDTQKTKTYGPRVLESFMDKRDRVGIINHLRKGTIHDVTFPNVDVEEGYPVQSVNEKCIHKFCQSHGDSAVYYDNIGKWKCPFCSDETW